jgi:hypothetical protein
VWTPPLIWGRQASVTMRLRISRLLPGGAKQRRCRRNAGL